ncbi:hypothetical protein [Amycolatopsis sp. NPDC059021]|uniref:hypothetical protein n=1 Tax=Amycolatopsis sp. NPDC059021 TaxID=3346704 RepID=UPI00366D8E65
MDELAAMLGAPAEAPLPVDWRTVEERLGLRLPSDYKSVADRYPAMFVNEFLRITHPACTAANMNLLAESLERTNATRELTLEFPDMHVYSVYPDPGGILCWGNTVNSDQCYWLTEGDPDEWCVVVGEEKGFCWTYDGNFSSFLLAAFSGDLDHSFYRDFTGALRSVEYVR